MDKINAQRVDIERLVSGLESIVQDLENSVDAMGSTTENRDKPLRTEIWEMEQEIAATR